MSKRSFAVSVALAVLALCPRALAWDASELQFAAADGETPGGGGIIGTGSKTDQRTECVHCHVEPAGEIDLTFAPNPPFDTDGDALLYEPDQEYEFSVTLTGEHLGLGSCPQGGNNANLMAATFEDANGANVGVLQSDTGQNQATNCPATRPDPKSITSGSTLLAVDCRVILSRDAFPGNTAWTFRWTAPAAGTGDVTLYGGGVDGDCDMTTLGDDAKMVKLTLSEGQKTALAPLGEPSRPAPWALSGVAPASGLTPLLLALALAFSALGSRLVLRRRRAS